MSQPVRIKGRDLEILHRHMLGETNKQIALDLGISETTVSAKINSDWFRMEMGRLHALATQAHVTGQHSALQIARGNSVDAINHILHLMKNARSETVQQRSAFDILDRSGFKAPTKVQVTDMNQVFDKMTAEELDQYAIDETIPARLRGLPDGPEPTVH